MTPQRRNRSLGIFAAATAVLVWFAPPPGAPVEATVRPTTPLGADKHMETGRAAVRHDEPLLALRDRDGAQIDDQFFWAPPSAAPAAVTQAASGSAPTHFPYEVHGRFVDGDSVTYLLYANESQEAVKVGDKVGTWQIDSASDQGLVVVNTSSGVRENIPLGNP